jgi:hypothetical protein
MAGRSNLVAVSEREMTSASQWKERLAQYAPLEEDKRSPESAPIERRKVDEHLLFIGTSSGYLLLEGDGPPPPLGPSVEVPGQAGDFSVMKVGRSPLPNDARSCAYLERIE